MARLTLRIEKEGALASKTLAIAATTLKTLKHIERNITGKKRAVTPWEVDVLSTPSCVLIVFHAGEDKPSRSPVAEETAAALMDRMEAVG